MSHLGRPLTGVKKFRNSMIQPLPEEMSLFACSQLLRTSLSSIQKWVRATKPRRRLKAKYELTKGKWTIKKEDLIEFLYRTGRIDE